MRYNRYSDAQIIETTGLSKVTIVRHVKNWNDFGLKSVEEYCDDKRSPKLSIDIVDNLLL